jgi:hypothetical protein
LIMACRLMATATSTRPLEKHFRLCLARHYPKQNHLFSGTMARCFALGIMDENNAATNQAVGKNPDFFRL